ncbi:hypothetical protein [Mesorhizobium sp. M7A.F.Ca.MR.362.00.0.0]|uniref:hypothetical protein n=1 Tax=Mesorhizobium sp. M7A.F.Ca.MR.362.00.0.0 TaxID=2496779 RepID=UPI000FD2F73F|nr:hypothetical protein [Mesorhizobium sp. M7A.F.Ca.MR.362.00.0.0]RUU80475.1 hypothetical protein EOC06_12030 [Mesorhizobium sp. M7A.F.Ca.MR.362.00.0.0]
MSTLDETALLAAFRVNHHPDAEPSSVELNSLRKSVVAYLASLSTPIAAGSGEAITKAARELLAECDARDTDPVFDESVTRGIRLLCNAAPSPGRIGEETEEAREVAWLVERKGLDGAAQPHWYAENEDDSWHWWTQTATEAKQFGSKAEAEGFPAYRMIASDPTISITEHVFLRASLSRKTAGEAEPVAWRVVTNNTAWSFYRTREEAEQGAYNRLTYVKGCTKAAVEPLYLHENLAS